MKMCVCGNDFVLECKTLINYTSVVNNYVKYCRDMCMGKYSVVNM